MASRDMEIYWLIHYPEPITLLFNHVMDQKLTWRHLATALLGTSHSILGQWIVLRVWQELFSEVTGNLFLEDNVAQY